jgi:hypothetical protein
MIAKQRAGLHEREAIVDVMFWVMEIRFFAWMMMGRDKE